MILLLANVHLTVCKNGAKIVWVARLALVGETLRPKGIHLAKPSTFTSDPVSAPSNQSGRLGPGAKG